MNNNSIEVLSCCSRMTFCLNNVDANQFLVSLAIFVVKIWFVEPDANALTE